MEFDVIVVGLGPVGAVLAGLLGRRGVKTLVIERDREVFALPRAAHVDHTGLRTIQEVGCLPEILKGSVRNRGLDLLDAQRRLLVRIPADHSSISGLPTSVYFYQPDFDRTVRAHATGFPSVRVSLGSTVTSIAQDAEHVEVTYRDPEDHTHTAVGKWLVGCDGAWSFTRESQGIRLHSLNFDEPWLVLDLLLKRDAQNLPKDFVIEVADPARPYLSTPISKNRQRFEFMLLPGEKPEAMKETRVAQHLLKDWIAPADYVIERSAVYTFHGLIAGKWRHKRVLLAGDAAHQTPPFLGQGMCTGIRDAANLAWKLERVSKGLSSEDLLDTYEEERKPHALKVIEAAIRIGKVICDLDHENAGDRNRKLLEGDSAEERKLSFALPRLEQGSLVSDTGGMPFPQLTLDGRLTDDILGPGFTFLLKTPEALTPKMMEVVSAFSARAVLLQDMPLPAFERAMANHQFLVIRPDRYVAGGFESVEEVFERMSISSLCPGLRSLSAERLNSQSL